MTRTGPAVVNISTTRHVSVYKRAYLPVDTNTMWNNGERQTGFVNTPLRTKRLSRTADLPLQEAI